MLIEALSIKSDGLFLYMITHILEWCSIACTVESTPIHDIAGVYYIERFFISLPPDPLTCSAKSSKLYKIIYFK
jgi:hypothetical protein